MPGRSQPQHLPFVDSRRVLSLSREGQITKVTFGVREGKFRRSQRQAIITALSREGRGLLSQFFQMPESIRGYE